MVKLKRAYEPAARGDGYRVLVERLWPRGVRKLDLPLDEWLKDIAPSTELRKWFSHDPERWAEFKRRYLDELRTNPGLGSLKALTARASKGTLTLVFSSHDAEHNNAVVLLEQIARRIRRPRAASSTRKVR
jgi:uncharacterized protein YeaO (DUF488 family)